MHSIKHFYMQASLSCVFANKLVKHHYLEYVNECIFIGNIKQKMMREFVERFEKIYMLFTNESLAYRKFFIYRS
jgi:hypothetical protein